MAGKEIIPFSEEARSLKLGLYRHFKGDVCQVIGISLHSETLEEMVTYKHISGERAGELYYWVRPLKMFLENVEQDGYKGPRFTFIGE